MPRPMNAINFGNTAGSTIKITYHNGSSTVTGYIVKQMGSNKFKVTSNGSDFFYVTLAQNGTLAATLTAGYATITCVPHGGSTKYIMKLTSKLCYTTDGNVYQWTYAVTSTLPFARINRNT